MLLLSVLSSEISRKQHDEICVIPFRSVQDDDHSFVQLIHAVCIRSAIDVGPKLCVAKCYKSLQRYKR